MHLYIESVQEIVENSATLTLSEYKLFSKYMYINFTAGVGVEVCGINKTVLRKSMVTVFEWKF